MNARGTSAELRALDLGPLALLTTVFLALVVLDPVGRPLRAALLYARAPLAAGEVWRLVTAHIIHEDLRHALLNVGGLGLLWLLYRNAESTANWLLVIGITALSIDAGLYVAQPQVEWYLGASGVLHGIWAAGAIFSLAHSRLEGVVMLGALLGKLGLEQIFGPLSGTNDGLGVVTVAHLYGALGGLSASALVARKHARSATAAAPRDASAPRSAIR